MDPTTITEPAPEPKPLTVDGALARLGEIREHLAPVADLQAERLRLLLWLKDDQHVELDAIAEADGSKVGAVRVSLSKARRQGASAPDTTDDTSS